MSWIGELCRQLRYRLSGARFDENLAEEMRLHLELRATDRQADRQAEGLVPRRHIRQYRPHAKPERQ